jgi:glucose/arabinose dehydrogenase
VLIVALATLASVAQATPANLAGAKVKLRTIATGLNSPIALAWRGTDANHMYVALQGGSVIVLTKGKKTGTALKLTGVTSGGEQGLLGIAFSNDGKKLYVDYNDTTGDLRIVEYTMNGNAANPATRRQLLVIPHHIFPNHNGGNLVVGPDNMLYIAVGDGGGGGDTLMSGQNTNVLLGKILRINPKPSIYLPYTIPNTNPFFGQAGKRGEIWMYGLRNPWRFSFDRKTGDMWIGDVGQNLYEEVDYAPAGTKGTNWGWNAREGKHPYEGGAMPPGAVDPILERPHSAGDCAIIGGYVYRSSTIKAFDGAYVFGDECTGKLRAVVQKNGAITQSKDLKLTVDGLASFGQGPGGGIYEVSISGSISLLVPA